MNKREHSILLFIVLSFLNLAKLCYFDVLCYPSAFGHGTWWAIAVLAAKLGASFTLASPVLFCKNRYVNILTMLLLDGWLISNVIYFHINWIYLNFGIIRMIGNMQGFESSVLPYLTTNLLVFPALSIAGIVALFILTITSQNKLRRLLGFVLSLLVCYVLDVGAGYGYYREKYQSEFEVNMLNIFQIPTPLKLGCWVTTLEDNRYVERFSMAHYFILSCWKEVQHIYRHNHNSLSAEEQDTLDLCTREIEPQNSLKGHLVVILLESFESWLLDEVDADGNNICPELCKHIHNKPTLIAKNMISQKVSGQSADGHMITLTGILPISDGITCNEYPSNVYPNYAHFFPKSVFLNPSRGCWNADITTFSYGFKTLVQPSTYYSFEWNDQKVMDTARYYLEHAEEPLCLAALTIDMHLPFTHYQRTIHLTQKQTENELVANYLKSARYTDECLGSFLQWADTAKCMQDATILITSDHWILGAKDSPQDDFRYIPAILTSPAITKPIEFEASVYQMDIFPTILHAIDQSNYLWRGFGIDLMDENVQNRLQDNTFVRLVSEKQAYDISNKILQQDYFNK